MIRRPPRSTLSSSSAASDVYKRQLVEVPEGAIFQRELYDYATVLKYQVLTSHRGDLKPGDTVYVGHYDPWKPRAEAADRRVKDVGGLLRKFRAGDVHHMAMGGPVED